MQKLQSIVWQDGKMKTDQTTDNIQAIIQNPQALVWIDIEGKAIEYAAFLSETLGLAPLVLETIDEARERAKFVERANYCHMIVHGLEYNSQTDEAMTPDLDIVFGKNFVLTVHAVPFQWLAELRDELLHQSAEEYAKNHQMGFLLYQILDNLVDSYFPVLDQLDDIIDELEDTTVNSTSNEVQVRLFRIKRAVAHMRRVISPQVEIANSLRSRTGHLVPDELSPYLGDVYDHMIRAFEVLDSYRDLMSGLLDVYLTTVSNRLNVIMKQLAIVSTIFLPITFITGVFGQNFGHSPQIDHDTGYDFWIVLALMLLITAGQIYFFKRRKWL